MLQLGSSIKYLHKGDNFLNMTLQNEFGIKLYGGKGAHYHPSVFLHWELYMIPPKKCQVLQCLNEY